MLIWHLWMVENAGNTPEIMHTVRILGVVGTCGHAKVIQVEAV